MSARSSRALRRIAPMVDAVRHDEGINRIRLTGLEDKIKALELRLRLFGIPHYTKDGAPIPYTEPAIPGFEPAE